MTKLQELRKKREESFVAIKELREKFTQQGDKWADESQRSSWTKVNEEYNATDAEIRKLTDADEVGKRFQSINEEREREERNSRGNGHPGSLIGKKPEAGVVTDEMRSLALRGWLRHQMGEQPSKAQREACRAVGLSPNRRSLKIDLCDTQQMKAFRSKAMSVHPSLRSSLEKELRALTVGTGSSGGNTVPQSFMYNLEMAMLAFGGVRQVADIIRTEDGAAMPWPTANDTSNKGALVAENAQSASNADPSFGVKSFGAYKFTSKIVLVPFELIEDSAFDVASMLAEMLGERLGRVQNDYATTGTGSSQPAGVVTGSTAGKTAAATNAITAGELIELQHSVDPAYRPNASWMLHDNVLLALRLLQDDNGQFLWQPGLQLGVPDRLLGAPVTPNQSMASTIEASAKTVLYGDMSKMKIREVRSIRLRRLVERYADYDQEGFVAFLRFDSAVVNAGTNPIKHLVQAAS